MTEHERIVRVPLAIDLIRQMDRLLLTGAGGYQTRVDFIRDAIEAYVLEHSYEPAPAEPVPAMAPPAASKAEPRATTERPVFAPEWINLPEPNLQNTILRAPVLGAVVERGIARVQAEPLFGLHNRDYPSIWAARRLADLTITGLIPVEDFVATVIAEAWVFADALTTFERPTAPKLTAMFPTNKAKPQSAEEGFKAFALGTYTVDDEGIVGATGPLYLWRVCQLERHEKRLLVGLTGDGYELLNALDGISLETPHATPLALAFFAHLRSVAPADWWGFRTAIEAIEPGIKRTELIEVFKNGRPDWTDNEASTNAAGYVARAREWGLVEPKQDGGRYALTPFGKEQLDSDRGIN